MAERVPLTPHPNDHNLAYLLTKRDRMGHDLPNLERRGRAMSGHGAPTTQPVDCSDLRVAVVAASWHTQVMDGLVAGAERALADYQVTDPEIVRVPGTFELPVVAPALAQQGYDAVVALGVVIRGGTPHFEYVCSAATDGLTRVALDHRWPSASACSPATPRSRPSTGPGWTARRRTRATRRPPRRCSPRGRCAEIRAPATTLGLAREDVRRALGRAEREGRTRPDGSGTVQALDAGVHAIGKKLVEEAAESWMAAEHEGQERAAEEISQLLYHAQVLMLARGIALDDVYAHL